MTRILAAAFVAATMALPATAAVLPWTAELLPENEVPPIDVPGAMGTAEGTIDSDTGDLTWTVDWDGLTGPATRLHFHQGAADENGPVIVFIFDALVPGQPAPFGPPVSGSATLGGDELAAFLDDEVYVNLHTDANPGGEIRGQVDVVPVPAALPLLAGGLAGLALVARRRREPTRI